MGIYSKAVGFVFQMSGLLCVYFVVAPLSSHAQSIGAGNAAARIIEAVPGAEICNAIMGSHIRNKISDHPLKSVADFRDELKEKVRTSSITRSEIPSLQARYEVFVRIVDDYKHRHMTLKGAGRLTALCPATTTESLKFAALAEIPGLIARLNGIAKV